MTVFMLIVFGLATVRAVIPLADKNNYNAVQIFLAVVHVAAYIILLNHFVK